MKSGSSAHSRSGGAFAYPEGWFQVGYSDALVAGQVVSLRYFGRDLVMFRTMSGTAQVLDAFCAHLGAHLGVGGKVDGERLRCPFHGWEYGNDGVCRHIPYSKRIPEAAAVTSWPTMERAGLILMWHSAAGNPPLWQPPDMPEYGDPAWTSYVVRQRYVVRTSAQEIVENIADVAHFQFVHSNAAGTEAPKAEFTFDRHIMSAQFRIDIGGVTTHVVMVHGLGLAHNSSVGYGEKRYWSNYTPIDRDFVDVFWSMLAALGSPDDPSGELSRRGLRATLREFEKDIPIWQNKIHRANPLICKDDGPIGRYRLWARQFYPHTAHDNFVANDKRPDDRADGASPRRSTRH